MVFQDGGDGRGYRNRCKIPRGPTRITVADIITVTVRVLQGLWLLLFCNYTALFFSLVLGWLFITIKVLMPNPRNHVHKISYGQECLRQKLGNKFVHKSINAQDQAQTSNH